MHPFVQRSTSMVIGADPTFTPVRELPAVTTAADLRSYLDLLSPIITALYNDARKNLVWDDPWNPYKAAIARLWAATAIDRQQVPNQPSPNPGPSDPNRWDGTFGAAPVFDPNTYHDWNQESAMVQALHPLDKAKALRYEAKGLWQTAKDLSSAMLARNIAAGPVPTEASLWQTIDTLFHVRLPTAITRAYTGLPQAADLGTADDFRELQGLDVDTQRSRASYQGITGRDPGGNYPAFIAGNPSEKSPAWLSSLITLAGIGVFGYLGINVLRLMQSRAGGSVATSVKLPAPAPSLGART